MSLISTATYDQLEVMVKSAVSTGLHDHATGRPHVPRPLLEKLQGLSQRYSLALKAYRDDKAMGKDLRKRRDEVSARLARHVRNIHFMFHRLFGMGDVRRLDMALFGIPETSMREAAHRIDIWRHQAALIIRGFHERQAQKGEPLPPYLMSPAIIELISEQKTLADEVAEALRSLQSDSQHRHQHLQNLRAQLVHQMEWLHKYLEVSLFEHQRPIRIEIMKNYGIPVTHRRRSSKAKDAPTAAAHLFAQDPAEATKSEQTSVAPVDVAAVAKETSPGSTTPPTPVTAIETPHVGQESAPPLASTQAKPAKESDPPVVAQQKPPGSQPAEELARKPGELLHKVAALSGEEVVVVSDERWEQLMADDPDALVADLEDPSTSPKQATSKKATKKKGAGVIKGQRKPPTKKEKEKKKTNRKMARKSRRGK